MTARPKSKSTTHSAIERGYGLLKPKPGEKSFAQERAEHKASEKALEDHRGKALN